MNSKTKIIVLRRKDLLIGVIAAVIVVALLIWAATSLLTKNSSENPSNTKGNVGTITKEDIQTNAGAAASNNTAAKAGANLSNTYTPGVYTASLTLNGNPVDIQVTVDKNSIQSIELNNLSESVTTMYPMLQTSFEELKNAVMTTGTTKNITYASENKYTATMLLNGIQAALDKCTVR